jgi:branched-chain amino acid transport system ATP-binding protein
MLRLQTIEAGYDETVVLRDVELTVPDRAVVALIGANGAGKTTLMRAASGLLPVRRGRVLVGDVDLTGRPPQDFVAAGVHHVPEGRAVFGSLTVRENLRMFTDGAVPGASVDEVLDLFPRLRTRLAQPAGTLSGGEQQMLALSRVYLRRPRFILLDEVSMGLAPLVVEEIFTFLRTLADAGVALLLVEQYVRLALEFADFVYTLHRGQITFAGEPAELVHDDIFARYSGAAAAPGPQSR